MTRSLGVAALVCIVFTVPSAVETASAAVKKRRSKGGVRTTIRAEGATLEFQKLALPAGTTDESVALGKLRELKGTLKLQKDVTYRRSTLPAGSYPITVVQDASKKYYFVIGNPPKEEAKKKTGKAKKKKSTDTAGMGIAGDYLRRLAEDADADENEPAKKKSKSTRKKKSSRRRQAKVDETSEPVEKKGPESAEAQPWLRARMYFSELEKATMEARFDLKTVQVGRKLELSACAGTNCGRARLTFVATPKK